MRERNLEIDILKGMAIILVVIGHTKVPGNNFIYLFHMAIFFMISGYCYNDNYSDSISQIRLYIVRKVHGLWVPYFFGIGIFVLLNNIFMKLYIYTNNQQIFHYVEKSYASTNEYLSVKEMISEIVNAFFFSGETQLAGTFWFLKILFFVSILFCIIDFIVKKISHNILRTHITIAIILLIMGYYCSLIEINLFSLGRMMSIYSLFLCGYVIKKRNFFNNLNRIYFICSILILILLNNTTGIDLGNNKYRDPFTMIVASLSGWILLMSLSNFLRKTKLGIVLAKIGCKSLPIMTLHFLSFKIVSLVYIYLKHLPIYTLAAFPVIVDNGLWWILYTIIGIIVPITLYQIYRYIFFCKIGVLAENGKER